MNDHYRRDVKFRKLVREAIALHVGGLREAGDPVPRPTAVGTARVDVPAA